MVTLLSGPTYLAVLVIPFLAWLLVRHRPLRVWPMGAFVVAAGIVLARVFPEYSGMLPALGVAAGILVRRGLGRSCGARRDAPVPCAPGERSGAGAAGPS